MCPNYFGLSVARGSCRIGVRGPRQRPFGTTHARIAREVERKVSNLMAHVAPAGSSCDKPALPLMLCEAAHDPA